MKKYFSHLVSAVFGIVLVTLIGQAYWRAEFAGFTPWMSGSEMQAYLDSMEEKGADGKNYFDRRHWISDLKVRWDKDANDTVYRLKVTDAPQSGAYWWYWWLGMSREVYERRDKHYEAKNFKRVAVRTYKRPDNTVRYNAIWHKIGADPAPAH